VSGLHPPPAPAAAQEYRKSASLAQYWRTAASTWAGVQRYLGEKVLLPVVQDLPQLRHPVLDVILDRGALAENSLLQLLQRGEVGLLAALVSVRRRLPCQTGMAPQVNVESPLLTPFQNLEPLLNRALYLLDLLHTPQRIRKDLREVFEAVGQFAEIELAEIFFSKPLRPRRAARWANPGIWVHSVRLCVCLRHARHWPRSQIKRASGHENGRFRTTRLLAQRLDEVQ
jgi:hypothetical protein